MKMIKISFFIYETRSFMNEKDEKKIIRHFRKERNQILPAKFYTGINLGVVAL